MRITSENRMDLMMWRTCLRNPLIFNRPFIEMTILSSTEIDMYSDASGRKTKGFGAYYLKNWCYGRWSSIFMEQYSPSIEYLELFGVTVAVLLWLKNLKNRRICLFCDNKSVCSMINNSSASCGNCMILIRLIT